MPAPVSVEDAYRVVGVDQARVQRLADDAARDMAVSGEPLSEADYQAMLDLMVIGFLSGML